MRTAFVFALILAGCTDGGPYVPPVDPDTESATGPDNDADTQSDRGPRPKDPDPHRASTPPGQRAPRVKKGA